MQHDTGFDPQLHGSRGGSQGGSRGGSGRASPHEMYSSGRHDMYGSAGGYMQPQHHHAIEVIHHHNAPEYMHQSQVPYDGGYSAGPAPVRVQATTLQQAMPMAQGYHYEPHYQMQHAQAMPMQSQYKEIVTLQAQAMWDKPPMPMPQQQSQTISSAYSDYEPSNSSEPSINFQKRTTKTLRSAPPPPNARAQSPPSESEEEEPDIPMMKAKRKTAQRASWFGGTSQVPPAPEAPPTPAEIIYVDHEEPVYRNVSVEKDILIPRHEKLTVEKINPKENVVYVERVLVSEELVDVEKIVVKEIQVPFDVYVDNIVVKEVVQEIQIERLVVKEVEVPVDRVVVKEVSVPIERIVENIITQEVPVERIVVREISVPIERVVIKDVQVPVERIIERIIHKPVELIVEQERIVHQERIVYQDRVIEVPVERRLEVVPVYQPPVPVYRAPAQKIGLGLLLKRSTQTKGMTVVEDILPGFACANSGQIHVGDFVTAVDDQGVEGWEIDNIKQLTIGEEGTMCTLTCRRGNDIFNVPMIRVSPPIVGSKGQKAINSYFPDQ